MYVLRPHLSIPHHAARLAVLLSALILSFPAQTGSQGTVEAAALHVAVSTGVATETVMKRRVNSDACLTEYQITDSLIRLGFAEVELGENVDAADMLVRVRFSGGHYLVRINRCTALLQDVIADAGEGGFY